MVKPTHDYSFYSLNILGWSEGKQDYPSPLNDNTTVFVFEKEDGQNMLFLLVEYVNLRLVYSKIEVYKYDPAEGAYAYTGKNMKVSADIQYAIDDIFEEASVRSIASKLYTDSVDFKENIAKSSSSYVYTPYNQMVLDLKKAMKIREKYKNVGDTNSVKTLDEIIHKILLTFVFPVEEEGDDYYIDDFAPLDKVEIENYSRLIAVTDLETMLSLTADQINNGDVIKRQDEEMHDDLYVYFLVVDTSKLGTAQAESAFERMELEHKIDTHPEGIILVNAKFISNIISKEEPLVWKYKFFAEDPNINLYHYDCSTWDDITIGIEGQTLVYAPIYALDRSNMYLCITACLDNKRSLAEGIGTVQVGELHWIIDTSHSGGGGSGSGG